MKKIVIPVVAVLLLLGGMIGYGIARSTEFMTYQRQCSGHIIYLAQEGGDVVAESTDGTKTLLTFRNTDAFMNAATRSEAEFMLFVTGLGDMQKITVTFPDDAKFEVFDGGGEGKNDVAYVRHTYKGKSKLFRIKGYKTFSRVSSCISPNGWNGSNKIIE